MQLSTLLLIAASLALLAATAVAGPHCMKCSDAFAAAGAEQAQCLQEGGYEAACKCFYAYKQTSLALIPTAHCQACDADAEKVITDAVSDIYNALVESDMPCLHQ